MPAAVVDLAAIHRHLWPQLTPSFEDLPVPGPEAHSLLGWAVPRALLPHSHVQAVDGDVLRHLGAEQVQKVHLYPADSKLHLGGRDGLQAGLSAVCEVAGDFNGVRYTAKVRIYPVGTVHHPLLTVHEVPADPGGVFLGAQGRLNALDEVAEVV